jgi:hypothetical protein|tara:strand:+ start:226 stop:507 length:282 start_codon:yes stop_codon:yes gene_type:complete
MNIKTFKFVGEHPDLHTGTYYSLKEYSQVAEVGLKTLCSRMLRYRHVEVDNNFLSIKYSKPDSNLEGDCEKLSMQWLRKQLTTIDPDYKEYRT